jgi:hypothetical protein
MMRVVIYNLESQLPAFKETNKFAPVIAGNKRSRRWKEWMNDSRWESTI